MRKFFTHTDSIVPVHHPRVLVETAVAQGADRAALLVNTGLTDEMLASPNVRVSYMQYGLLTANAFRLTRNPALGLDVGRNTGVAQMGVLGLALMNSPTIGEALQLTLRHYRTIAPVWELDVAIEGKTAILSAREAIPLTPFLTFATEVLLVAFDQQGRALFGRSLPIQRLRLAYSRPPYAERYAKEFYDVPISFDEPLTAIEFDADLLETKVAFADPATAELAEQIVVEQAPVGTSLDGLVAQVRRLLDTARGRPPALEEMASRLQTSTRSLRRALQQMRTSYHELLDESRRARAERWVKSKEMPIEQIAERLGFSSPGSFRRAFKRWTGRTPGALRDGADGVD
jgi:AraC-like DNA-binding protein